MEYIIGNLLLGLLVGFVGLFLPNLRTMMMLDGHYIKVFFVHILASCMLVAYTLLVSKGVIPFMIGNTIGGAIAVTYLSYRRSKKNDTR